MAHFSDTWQLVINTGTTIVTFLMVALAANAAARDGKALHAKLDGIADAQATLMEAVALQHVDEEHCRRLRQHAKDLRRRTGLEKKVST